MGKSMVSEKPQSEKLEWAREFVDSKAYFWIKKDNAVGNQVCFPVDIKDARISFGKVHFRVVPHSVSTEGLGTRWVERSQLFLPFDMSFKRLEGTYYKEPALCPVPSCNTNDYKSPRDRQGSYDHLFGIIPGHARFQRGFLRLGKNLSKDVLYFPIQIKEGRHSFGTPQFQIVPYGTIIPNSRIMDKEDNVGNIWVEKGTLILEHHMAFEGLRVHYDAFSVENLRFDDLDEDHSESGQASQ